MAKHSSGKLAEKAKKKPYKDRDDLDKLASQWRKLLGLQERAEPSAAIVRCGTAAEIAANYAIRTLWGETTDFDKPRIDSLLRWANGLSGKVSHLFVPIYFDNPKSAEAKALLKLADDISRPRNEVVHSGHFSKQSHADEVIDTAEKFINLLVGYFIDDFDIEKHAGSSEIK